MNNSELQIRLVQPGDAEQIMEIYRPSVEKTAVSFEIETPSVGEMERRIRETVEIFPWLVCYQGDVIAGYAYASSHRQRFSYQWTVETSVYIHPDFSRRGIASALYASLLSMLKAQGFCTALAGMALPHPASAALHQFLGFEAFALYKNVGFKFEKWHDVQWWRLSLQEDSYCPQLPIPLREFFGSEAWKLAIQQGLEQLNANPKNRLTI